MTIERLMEVIPPPTRPFDAFGGPWEPIEVELGTPLPQAYKDFVRVYGSGQLLGFFGLYVPQSRNPNVRLAANVRAVRSWFSDDEELPYPLWPDPGGLLCIGSTDNGDSLFLLPPDGASDWRVVVWDRDVVDVDEYDSSLTDFLADVACGKVQPKAFPDDLVPSDHPFTPSGSLTDWREGGGRHLIGIRAHYRFRWNSWRMP